MPREISNIIPIINTVFSIVLFSLSIYNTVDKEDKKNNKKLDIILISLIGLTFLINLYFRYGNYDVNKSSSFMFFINIALAMWLISLMYKEDTPEENEKFNKKKITSVVSGILMVLSFALIYFNNKEQVDTSAKYLYDTTSDKIRYGYDKARDGIGHMKSKWRGPSAMPEQIQLSDMNSY